MLARARCGGKVEDLHRYIAKIRGFVSAIAVFVDPAGTLPLYTCTRLSSYVNSYHAYRYVRHMQTTIIPSFMLA